MTTYNDMRKADLNAILPENLRCKNASEIKKSSKQAMINMLERRGATQAEAAALASQPKLTDLEQRVTVAYLAMGIDCNGCETLDEMLADNMTWGDVPAIAKATGLTQKQVQGVIASLSTKGLLVVTDEGVNGEGPVQQVLSDDGLRAAFDLMADGVEAKPAKAQFKADKPTRKPRGLDDRVIQAPGKAEGVRPTKEGSKRALLVIALQRGATIEHLMEVLGWNRETVSSALRTDLKAIGLGCERRKGKYHRLLPEGMKKLPLRDATTSRADALAAACK